GIAGLKRVAKEHRSWLDDLAKRLSPLTDALARPASSAESLLRAHDAAAHADGGGAARLWAGDAGEAAARFLDELLPALRDNAPIKPADYPELLEALLA